MKRDIFRDKLLVCDMDGTLLNSSHQVSRENLAAIKRFIKNGGSFTVATGRMKSAVQPYLDTLPVNAPAILYNGAAIYDFANDSVLWQNVLPREAGTVLKDIMKLFPDIGVEAFDREGMYILNESEGTERHKLLEEFRLHEGSPDELPMPWYKVLFAGDHSRLNEVEKYICSSAKDIRCVYSEYEFLELLCKDTSKGYALKKLVEIMKLQHLEIIALGDNLNDLEMIEYAKTGVAVGNAHEELKKAAAMCCCSNDEHAVSSIVEMLEEGLGC